MFERFTETSRQVVVHAQEEARTLGHNYIGTEHILLGILCPQDRLANRTLTSLGVSAERAREELARLVAPSDEPVEGMIPFTSRAKRVLELSLREALSLGHSSIENEHLLLGLLREREGVAARILTDLGVDLEQLRVTLVEAMPGPDPSPLVTAARPEQPPAVGSAVGPPASQALSPTAPRGSAVSAHAVSAHAVTVTPDPGARRLLMRAGARALADGRTEFTVEDLLAALSHDEQP